MNEIIQLSEEQHRYLQLNELQLLVEVDRICRKYNIDYSLDGGTLLGAIRMKMRMLCLPGWNMPNFMKPVKLI